ncbi:MAG: cupredoxin domain-containing protein [Methylococcales bacterium]|nr:cupredoxin domain-containing protein [Methylococcales bacterium]MBT7443768.1 cupredoxin domain-containing protein [Methylococcales bacterium]
MKKLTAVFMLLGLATPVFAGTPSFTIEIKNHLFYPDVLTVPANKKVKLIIINRDESSEEFESYELNREKIITGGRKGIVFIGPLAPGEYPYFGEFHPKTALGKIIAQ